jgi:hypothetical protein
VSVAPSGRRRGGREERLDGVHGHCSRGRDEREAKTPMRLGSCEAVTGLAVELSCARFGINVRVPPNPMAPMFRVTQVSATAARATGADCAYCGPPPGHARDRRESRGRHRFSAVEPCGQNTGNACYETRPYALAEPTEAKHKT